MYGDNGIVAYKDEKKYEIISDKEFKDEENNIYEFRVALDK